MQWDNVKELKDNATTILARKLVSAFSYDDNIQTCIPALGIFPTGKQNYHLAVHIRDQSGLELIEPILNQAKGEVNIQITGEVYPRINNYYQRPLSIGLSISHYDSLRAGTLGCFVRKKGESDLLILSNNHVLVKENKYQNNDHIIHPAIIDLGDKEKDKIGILKDFIPLKANQVNIADAAIAQINSNINVGNVADLMGLGTLKGVYNDDMEYDEQFIKIGRTSGVTYGKINAIELDNIELNYNAQLTNCRFEGIIAIEGQKDEPFSRPGDSGSIIVDSQGYAIALLFAGTTLGGKNKQGLTYAIPINTVLEQLNIELATTV